jgi:hypothetical protein
MAIGTTRNLPFGITAYERRGAGHRRRLAVICALSALAVATFVVTERAQNPMTASPAPTEAASAEPSTTAASVNSPVVPSAAAAAGVAEAPIPPPTPAATSNSVNSTEAIDAPSALAATPEPPNSPTVLRGVGIKPR